MSRSPYPSSARLACHGADGAVGRNLLNGERLPSKCAGELSPGDRLRIETPGGGGHGAPDGGDVERGASRSSEG